MNNLAEVSFCYLLLCLCPFSVNAALPQSDGTSGTSPAQITPNVLMISIDNLNDWVGFLGGHPETVTPHMDALATRDQLVRWLPKEVAPEFRTRSEQSRGQSK